MRTDILVDGLSAGQTGNFGSFTELAVPVDAVQEFNLIKGAFSAEYGYVQTAVVSFSLKSGTNEFHGTLFENFRNDVLNSRSFFEGDRLPFQAQQLMARRFWARCGFPRSTTAAIAPSS